MKTFSNYVVITDDKGKERAFYNFHELIKYLDSLSNDTGEGYIVGSVLAKTDKMSFLPDGFSYTIHEEQKWEN